MAGKEMGTGRTALAALQCAGALWEIETRPAYFEMPGEGFLPSGSMWVTRTDTNRPVTDQSVSKSYQTFQNRAMGEWADLLVDVRLVPCRGDQRQRRAEGRGADTAPAFPGRLRKSR